MINLNTYIIEKLKINKESNLSKYNIGDHCLIFSFYNWESNNLQPNKNEVTIGIDVIKLRKITDEQIHYDYLTTFCHTNENTAIMNLDGKIRKHSRYYCSNISNIIIEAIIPANESFGIIKEIEKKKYFNLFDKIGYCPEELKSFENIDVPIKLRKNKIQKEITQQDINEIKNKLNNPTKITEKLQINKDSKVKKVDPNAPLYEKYSKGDRCLLINESGLQNQTKIRIEVIEIQRVTKTIVDVKILTNVSGGFYFNSLKYKDNKSNNYISNSGTTSSWMIVTSEDSLDILEMIKKNNYKLDFYSILWKSGKRMDLDLIPVVEKIEGTDGSSFKDYKPITTEKFRELEDAL